MDDTLSALASTIITILGLLIFGGMGIYGYFSINMMLLRNILRKRYVVLNSIFLLISVTMPLVSFGFSLLFVSESSTPQASNSTVVLGAALAQATRSIYAEKKDYTGLNSQVIIDSKQIPEKFTHGNELESPYGTVDIFPTED
jgi:hypothetical protein